MQNLCQRPPVYRLGKTTLTSEVWVVQTPGNIVKSQGFCTRVQNFRALLARRSMTNNNASKAATCILRGAICSPSVGTHKIDPLQVGPFKHDQSELLRLCTVQSSNTSQVAALLLVNAMVIMSSASKFNFRPIQYELLWLRSEGAWSRDLVLWEARPQNPAAVVAPALVHKSATGAQLTFGPVVRWKLQVTHRAEPGAISAQSWPTHKTSRHSICMYVNM